jgi:undecaprenyl pyrophosphate synthase
MDDGFSRRCKRKIFKKDRALVMPSAKCFHFVRAIKDGKGPPKRKGGSRQGGHKEGARRVVEVGDVLARGGGFVLDEDEGRGEGTPRAAELSCPPTPAADSQLPVTPVSGLQLLLEESSSLVSETPIPLLSEPSRKELDASRLHSLQKSNGFYFKVVDKTMVSRLKVLEDIEVAKEEKRERARGDQ